MKTRLAATAAAVLLNGVVAAAPLLPEERPAAPGVDGRIEFMTGPAGQQTTRIWGYLALPDDTGRPAPAMVVMHGSTGLADSRRRRYERLLAQAGIAAFHVDSFSPRGLASTAQDQSLLAMGLNTADAFNALRILQHHPRIDPARIGVMGFSRGGGVAWMSAIGDWFRDFRSLGLAFALHVPYYPGCAFPPDRATTGAPILFLLGGADDWVGAHLCGAFAAHLRRTNPRVELQIYPGARHGWEASARDGTVFSFPGVRNFTACPPVLLDRDGGGTNVDTGAVLDRAAVRTLVADCSRVVTVTAGPNAAVREASDRDLLAFLRREFGL